VFQVGATYTITIVEDAIGEAEAGETQYGGCKIIEEQWPCIKYTRGHSAEIILNVSSPRFRKAELDRR
jgi:hypothetical protein